MTGRQPMSAKVVSVTYDTARGVMVMCCGGVTGSAEVVEIPATVIAKLTIATAETPAKVFPREERIA